MTGTDKAGRDDMTGEAEGNDPIAIVGVGLRFPGGCESADDFDDLLRDGRSGISPLPEDRWDAEAFRPGSADEKGKIHTAGGGFLDRIDLFDAPFFNISPKEAQYVDPQQRLVLETAWHALEHAGVDPTPLRRGNGGVYIGASSIDYALEMGALPYEALDGHLASGITLFPLSGRLSYFLGWRGPSVTVDTACSSSLSALHMAAQGLRLGDCDIALCGGVNVLHHPSIMVMFSHGQMLAEDGQCKTFDEDADGYVRAEGCGMLVLKRYSEARRAGDRVLALVRGTAIGQDGDSAGLTVPNGPAQEVVIRRALATAGLQPSDIQYVEAHGTGTPIGDPIELGAINDVFAASHTRDAPLLVGSAKTNLGHMEPASGIVGVIKTVLQMRSGTVYPHLNLHTPSTRIPWDTYPIRVPTECVPWPQGTRRAVVNSFGFAGTIAASVLEESPAQEPVETALDGSRLAVFTLSAKSRAGLRRQAERYVDFLDGRDDGDDIRSLCRGAATGRAHFGHRLAGVVDDVGGVRKLLAPRPDDETGTTAAPRKTAFLFSGQGAQYAGMAADLYDRFPAFRDPVDACDGLFAPHLERSIRELLTRETGAEDIHRTEYTQPALFTLEYALARLWISWGIKPNVVLGHSIGEVAAATVAGLLTLPDAVTLVAARARLMQSVRAPGGMAAVSRPVEEIEPMLGRWPALAVAAVNAPGQCVISGDVAELDELTAHLAADGIRSEKLSVSHAFHSPLMAEVFDDFRTAMADITFHRPSVPIVSNLTGRVATYTEIASPDYWVRHIGEPVRFMAGVRAVEKRGRHTFLEIGPSAALTALARQSVLGDGHHWVASLRRRDGGETALLRALADLYTAGAPVDWNGVYAGQAPAPETGLPGYAFERKRYWLPLAGTARYSRGPAAHPLLGQETPQDEARTATGQEPSAVREFSAWYAPDAPFWQQAGPTRDDTPTLSPAAYPELLLALQDAVYGHTHAVVEQLVLHAPLHSAGDGGTSVRTRLRTRHDRRADVEVVSGPADGETLHASALLDPSALPLTPPVPFLPTGSVRDRTGGADLATDLAAVGWDPGRFGTITEIARHEDGTLVADLAPRAGDPSAYLPLDVLECALLTAVALDDSSPAFVPSGIGSLRLLKKPRGARLSVVAHVTGTGMETRTADLLIGDEYAPVAVLTGVEYRPALPWRRMPFLLHRHRWLRRSVPATADPAGRRVLLVGAAGAQADALTAHTAARGLGVTALDPVGELPSVLGGGAPGQNEPTGGPVTDVCWFWQPSSDRPEPMGHTRLRAECEHNYRRLLDLVAAATDAGLPRIPRLWLVTARAQWLPGDEPDGAQQPAAATLWGFGHVLLNENPRTRTTLVDLPSADPDGLQYLADALLTPDTGDYQLAYRGGRRHVRRLLPGRSTPAWDGEFEAVAPQQGESGQPRLVPSDGTAPTGDLIRVRVTAAALTRRAGTAAPTTPGSGCAGTVVAAGPAAAFAVGADVLVAHHSTLRRTVTVRDKAAVPLPEGVGPAAAAASVAAYTAAHHALIGRAGLTAGKRVVVHGADRAMVRAVVALAACSGAEVYVTAPPGEARTLRDLGAHDVLALPGTDDAAVPGAHLSPLATVPEAHLLVGVPDEPLPAQVTERLAADGRSVTVAPWPGEGEPGTAARICAAVERGELPLLPVCDYDIDELPEACEAAETGRDGHVVVTLTPDGPPEGAPSGPASRRGPRPPVRIRPDRLYLVTGGLGGVGIVTARALVDLGARHLLLVSRSGTPTPEAAPILADLAARADVGTERADVSSPTDMARLRQRLSEGPVPLGGIVHAAGVAGKSLIGRLTWEDIDTQLAGQAYGGWLLHELALDSPELDLFFVHSSIASVLGGSTQGHYAAAFSLLDHLVTLRRRSGQPALSVNWGAWGAVGMSARLEENLGRELERSGVRLFSPPRALGLFRELLVRQDGPYVAGWFDWNAYVAPSMVENALYSELVDSEGSGGDDRLDLAAFLGKPEAERREFIDRSVRAAVAAALQADDAEQIEPTTAFVSLGLDSLMALQLKTALEQLFRVPLPATLTFDHPSPRDLANFLGAQLEAHRE
ncbi:beta-ketoacyl synthase N-terminal-like domain-containing protein [Streptomyces sp. NPDC050560]|uniref:beta-ketoacyl synthase N-terminal-like domain-containing protein n=1 Tax=Streptomyces sp. NPDC050560 TaxID=3365630 RepID=UPI0037B0C544